MLEIPGLDAHPLNPDGRFVRSVELVLPAQELTEAMVQAGLAVVDELSRLLQTLGYSWNASE